MATLDTIVFVYQCEACFRFYCKHASETLCCPECNSYDRTRTATVNPAVIIERYLNGDRTLRRDLTGG